MTGKRGEGKKDEGKDFWTKEKSGFRELGRRLSYQNTKSYSFWQFDSIGVMKFLIISFNVMRN